MTSSKRRTALAVCVALLLVTAGCSGGTTPSSTTTENSDTATTTTTANPTTTASSTTTAGTWSPNASMEQYPPGVAENGTLTNASALVDAHFDATANEPMELTYEQSYPGTHVVNRYVHGPNKTPHYSSTNQTSGFLAPMHEMYRTNSHSYSRRVVDNESTYTVAQNLTTNGITWVTHPEEYARHDLTGLFYSGNYSVNGTVERDGQTFVQLTANESRAPDEVSSYDGTALVTPDGVIYNIDTSVPDPETEGEYYNDSVSLDTDVNWSGAPSWVADIPHLSLSVVEDGHALEIRNTGGEALPANASFDIYVRNTTSETVSDFNRSTADANGSVTTESRLEPGEVVYVTAGADGNASSFTLHDKRVRGEYTFAAAKVFGGNEKIDVRLVTGLVEDNSTA